MKKKTILKTLAGALFFSLFLSPALRADFSFSIGWGDDDFYFHVGHYDYYQYDGDEIEASFYDILSDYGRWEYLPEFGQVWIPYVSSSWRPFTQGHWVYTSYGWTWVAYEPWG